MKHLMLSFILAFTFCVAYAQKVDHYAGKESITYNGVEWKITDCDELEAYEIKPAISKYGYAPTRYKDGTKVPQEVVQYPGSAPSNSAKSEAAKAFAGHMEKLKGTTLYVDYWVNTETGRVEDVVFAFDKESPLTEFDISYFDNLAARIKKNVKRAKANSTSLTNVYDGFVTMSETAIFENMPIYTAPYPMI